METRQPSDLYSQIGMELIATEESLRPVAESDATIVFLASDLEKKANRKAVYGQCEKVPDRYRWAVPCDFTITVFEPNTERFTDEQLRILLLHELMHVGIERDGNAESYYVVPHDIEDFYEIVERFGAGWSE